MNNCKTNNYCKHMGTATSPASGNYLIDIWCRKGHRFGFRKCKDMVNAKCKDYEAQK